MSKYDIIFVGGGLAGALAVAALKRANPEISLAIIEQGARFGGNHRWSWFDGDLTDEGRALIAGLHRLHWPRHEVRFPRRKRLLELPYNSTTSSDLHRWITDLLEPAERLTATGVVAITHGSVTLQDGRILSAQRVIDARGAEAAAISGLGWQKFAGFEFEVPGHGLAHPIVMDATVDQEDGYRFVYTLPLDADRLFIEDTYYADGPDIALERLRNNAFAYAAGFGRVGAELSHETGALPIPLTTAPEQFWPASDQAVRLGMRGGFFHHTTGYSFPVAVQNALQLAADWRAGVKPDAAIWRARLVEAWRGQRYFRLLNRMLFGAAEAGQRYRVFEHFYRLPAPLIARFYAGTLTALDKARILTGRPPVPLGRAMAVFLGKS